MIGYLEEAAQLLRKAAEDNEELFRDRASLGSSISARRDMGAVRERIAMKFAQLGAIEAGLIPNEMIQDLLAAVARGESR